MWYEGYDCYVGYDGLHWRIAGSNTCSMKAMMAMMVMLHTIYIGQCYIQYGGYDGYDDNDGYVVD